MTHPRDLFDLSGKVAIVTGGGSGIGRQMSEGLAEMGADLVLCARKAERCEQAAEELRGLGVRAIGMGCDVRDPEQVQAVVDRARDELGPIDVLVNNAGTVWGGWPEDTPLEGWQKVLDVNLTGVFLCSQAAGRAMIEQGGGKIVNIASVAALGGAPPEIMNAIAYNATKGGVVSFTRDLATKWARHSINVNAIAPGYVRTDATQALQDDPVRAKALLARIPAGRWGEVEDMAGAAVFLASRASDYCHGTILVVDGGWLAG